MRHDMKVMFGFGGVLFAGVLLGALSFSTPARAESCPELGGGTCKHHGACDSSDNKKHCRDTLKNDGYHCECRRGKDDRPSGPSGPEINLGISLGIGRHGWIGFDVNTGGYCDRWGCPGDYWDYPVFYGPVYFEGEWYEGPVYYRYEDGDYWYWVHGGWRRDEWRGERPEWARETRRGPALGRDYYKSEGFRRSHERHGRDRGDDGDRHGDDHDDGDHDRKHDGDKYKDKDKDKEKYKGKGCGPH